MLKIAQSLQASLKKTQANNELSLKNLRQNLLSLNWFELAYLKIL